MAKRTLFPAHDPTSKLDYMFDLAPVTNGTPGGSKDWLNVGGGEVIQSYVLTAESGITLSGDALSLADTAVLFWVEITPETGADPKKQYSVSCEWISTAGRKDKRTIIIPVKDR